MFQQPSSAELRCLSCVLSCISLPVMAGSVLFSGTAPSRTKAFRFHSYLVTLAVISQLRLASLTMCDHSRQVSMTARSWRERQLQATSPCRAQLSIPTLKQQSLKEGRGMLQDVAGFQNGKELVRFAGNLSVARGLTLKKTIRPSSCTPQYISPALEQRRLYISFATPTLQPPGCPPKNAALSSPFVCSPAKLPTLW